ncbi:MAG: succinylglutamate desuccinylase/aspartoacylase family protein [bacterium]|nr:succinylglutamate desuccinylase/aspartoacylase family protein [bacterium]
MPEGMIELAETTSDNYRRVFGRLISEKPGPTIVMTGGIHGNEPAGLNAARRVLDRLEQRHCLRCGQFAVLAGNLLALRRKMRFIAKDLNRAWVPEDVDLLRQAAVGSPDMPEGQEQLELLGAIQGVLSASSGPVYFFDLHTSSALGPPFLTVGDTLRNRNFALQFPLPLILGLEEQVDGALLEYLNNYGLITVGVEAGQHDHPDSVDRCEAIIWNALVLTGMIAAEDAPDLEASRELLREASRGVPRIVEVRHRHAIVPEDEFRMGPGYVNFQPVQRGQVVAHDRRGGIEVPEDGLLLLPLYQGQGNDGFFVSREVRRVWLRLSTVARKLRLGRLIQALPGVRHHPERDDVLIVDTHIARWYPLEIFHLFGFRKLRRDGAELVVSRRRHDLTPPHEISLI